MLTISVPIQSQIIGWGRWEDGRQWQPLMKSQCQSPMGGRAYTPDHLAITMSCPALWSHASRQWPLCKTGACHDSSYPSEYVRFFKDLLIVLTLSTICYTCHLLRSVYSEIMGRVTLCLEQHLMNVFPEPSPKKKLRKESLNLGICAQLWVVS